MNSWAFGWTRVNAGHYTRDDGAEIIHIRSRWVLSHPYREESSHRSLSAAQQAADNI